MFSAAIATVLLTRLQADANMHLNGPFMSGVPTPESVLGYKIGSRITTYREQENVYNAIAAKSGGKVQRIDYGTSNQNFPLRVYAISSPKNIARWDQIQKAMEKAGSTGTEPPKDTPAIVWINETIHGNEPASFEAGMELFYNLVAGKGEFAKALDNTVVILNPVYNPDGHERFAVGYNSYARGNYQDGAFESYEINLLWGRYNHYRFDMNRDRISFSQKETQAEVKLMQSIRPQIYIDQHGQVQNYFFPPNPMAINANTDRTRINKWTDILGRACAKAFDKTGWSYFVREDFDLYAPCYLDSHASLSGAIGITHETDGGKVLAKSRDDGSISTLREGAAKHLTTALAVIKTAGEKRDELVADWAKFKRSAVAAEGSEMKRVFITSRDLRVLYRLEQHLARTGIKSAFAYDSARPGAKSQIQANDLWTNKKDKYELEPYTLVVDLRQEFGPVAKSLLERVSEFEKEFTDAQMNKKKSAPEGEQYPGPQGTEFYDLTGWALPFAYNLKAYWTDGSETIKTTPGFSTVSSVPAKVLGWVIPYSDVEDVLAVQDLLRQGIKVSVATADMDLGSKKIAKGSFVIFSIRNPENTSEIIRETTSGRSCTVDFLETSYPESGREGPGNRLAGLRAPNIGLVFGNQANMTGSSGTWFTLDQELKLPFVSLSTNALSTPAIRDYTAIIAPSGSNALSNTKVKDWVREGGVLVVYGENPSGVASFTGSSETRAIPGSILQAVLDKRSLLASGYDSDRIAVPVDGDSFFKARKEGGGVVKFADDDTPKHLTGWTWGEESEKAVKGTVWLHDEPLGRGHIIWFAQDPCERAMWPGLHKLLINSLILMPGN